MERRALRKRSELFERTKTDIAKRLRAVCTYSPEEEFQALIARMATVTIKYSQRRDILMFSDFQKN